MHYCLLQAWSGRSRRQAVQGRQPPPFVLLPLPQRQREQERGAVRPSRRRRRLERRRLQRQRRGRRRGGRQRLQLDAHLVRRRRPRKAREEEAGGRGRLRSGGLCWEAQEQAGPGEAKEVKVLALYSQDLSLDFLLFSLQRFRVQQRLGRRLPLRPSSSPFSCSRRRRFRRPPPLPPPSPPPPPPSPRGRRPLSQVGSGLHRLCRRRLWKEQV